MLTGEGPADMLPDIPAEQFAIALDACAAELLAATEMTRPPVDTFLLAERLNMVVARDSTMESRGRLVRLRAGASAGRGTILLADEPRPERRYWTVAHEIGESVAYRVFGALGVDATDAPVAARERVANHLASCLLLPRCWFLEEARAVDWDLLELKQCFRTASHELIARRMLEMSPPVIITLFDQGKPQWRRSNSLCRIPKLTEEEKQTWYAAFDGGKASQFAGDHLPEEVVDVRCWPIHEPGWRREILRTALAEAW